MQRAYKVIYIFIFAIMFFFSITSITFAAADGNAGNNSYIDNNGERIFPLGCRSRWSGFLLYIIDGDNNLQSNVKVVVSQRDLPSYNNNESVIYTRLGSGSVDLDTAEIRTGGLGGYPPFDSNGNACGGDIRDWMLSKDNGRDYNLYMVLEDYFSSDISDVLRKFVNNEWYLIIEPFFWYGYYAKDEATGNLDFTGCWVCGTAPGIAEQENLFNLLFCLDSEYGSPYFRRYTNKNFPNCCRFFRGQFGIDVLISGGTIKSMPTNDEIIRYGYGIMSFWAGEITVEDIIPPTDIVEDTYKAVDIGLSPEYYIGNRVEGYDVSHSIPKDSTIRNVAEVASFYFEELNIGVRKYTRNYNKPIILYEETILEDGSSIKQVVYNGSIKAKASIEFEYLKELPDIFKFAEMTVKNKLYEYNKIEYKENLSFFNDLRVSGSIYNGDSGDSPEKLMQDSRFVPGNAHFILPEYNEKEVSLPFEAVINTVNLKKENRACTNTNCRGGLVDDWEWCEECGGDGEVSETDNISCIHCTDGDISTNIQCGSCYGTGLGGTIRCSDCGAQSFEEYQICDECGEEGEPGDYTCFNCNGNGYTSKSWLESWIEYVPDQPCAVCDATGYSDGELCYLCNGAKNAGTPHYHEGTWAYNVCMTCDGTKTVFMCPQTNCHGSGSNFTEMSRCSNCGNDEVTNKCEECEGKGNVDKVVSCQTCGGDGMVTTISTRECDYCYGGYVDIEVICGVCGGDGIIQPGNSVITDTNRYLTAEEIIAIVKEQAEIMVEFINSKAKVWNDLLVVEDNYNTIIFMDDEPVMGAEVITGIEGQLHVGKFKADENMAEYSQSSGTAEGVVTLEGGNAAESKYCIESCIENSIIPTKIIMDVNVDVSAISGEESAPTGAEVYYEHVLLGYDVYLCAGKAVNGNVSTVDNIYNHVLEEYLGAYHNGGDPDDGYPIVVSENAVEVPTTTPMPDGESVTDNERETVHDSLNGDTTSNMENVSGDTGETGDSPENITLINYLSIVDYNFTEQTTPSSQLVDVVQNAEYYLELDNSYYLLLAERPEDNEHVVKKEIKVPFDIYYNGIYYSTGESGYTEWIELSAPDKFDDGWDNGISVNEYESENHWFTAPIYIPSWAKETDSAGTLTYVHVRVINKLGEELISSASVQLSGVLYGFTITGINDISQYYKVAEVSAGKSINFNAAVENLEWRVGKRNRIGGTYLRYLSDGTLVDVAEDYQTLPIRKGSGDGSNLPKTGDGEMSVGTSFSFIVKTISGLIGSNDYIEIIPHFKYLMPDGTIIDEDSLLILYEHSADTKWYVAGSNMEKEAFMELVEYGENRKVGFGNEISAYLGLERFNEAYYDADDTTLYRYGDWIKYTLEQYNRRLSISERINVYRFMNRQYLTNLLGMARISSGLRLYSGEFEQLAVNLDKDADEVIVCEDYNQDGMADIGYDEERFRQSMQTWYGNYMVNQNMYIVNKSLHPEFWVDGNPIRLEADERIMRNGKLIIGFEINAYKNGVKHLTYGDMWKTEGQRRYTVKEYIPNSDNVGKKDPDFQYDKIIYDSLMIDYGDIAVVDINDRLSDDYWNSGSFIIN